MTSNIPNSEVIAATNMNLSRLTSLASLKRNHVIHQPSMLDLIDDTKLTSLPLPPPPKLRGRSSTQSNSVSLVDVKSCTLETNNYVLSKEDSLSDESDDDADADPIVLIEDYMILLETPSLHRQKSLATFKKRLLLQEIASMSEISTLNTTDTYGESKRGTQVSIDQDIPHVRAKRSISNDGDAIRGYLPGSMKFPQTKPNNGQLANGSDHGVFNNGDQTDGHQTKLSESQVFGSQLCGSQVFGSQHFGSQHFGYQAIESQSKLCGSQTNDNIDAEPYTNEEGLTNINSLDSISSSTSKKENLKEIFGQIPGTDMLKYCDLCEKPLYEISSIINNHKKVKKSVTRSVYSEFVCWECVDAYEDFFNEMYQNELEETKERPDNESPINREKLLEIFRKIDRKYEKPRVMRSFYRPKRVVKKLLFSDNLIGRLSSLAAPEQKQWGQVDFDWFRTLQWSWGK